MKIAITGASGFVGRQLVPLLQEAGHELVVLGRSKARLLELFPHCTAGNYEDLKDEKLNVDLLVHLSVINNDADVGLDKFRQVNVDLFQRVVADAQSAGIGRVLNVSSTHALDPKNHTHYAVTKREALAIAHSSKGIDVVNIFLPSVHGDAFAGKLAVLGKLPRWVSRVLFSVLSALRPTVHVRKLADFVTEEAMTVDPVKNAYLADDKANNFFFRTCKRLIDIAFSLAIAGFFWWLMLIVWVLVRLESTGEGIFRQVRVGRSARTFTCYKFRTMSKGTPQVGTHEVSGSSVTRIGGILRKTKLDELPQIWNLLRGDMSLVGPRPCLPVQHELVEERKKSGVLKVLPGITGLAQIRGVDMSDVPTLVDLDQQYIAQRSLLNELAIIVATVLGGGRGDRVSQP